MESVAAAQSTRTQRAGLVTPAPASVEGRVTAARDAFAAGNFARAETLIARLPARVRARDDIAWLAIRARAAIVALPVEPGAVRTLAAAAQNDATALHRRVARYAETHATEADPWLLRAHIEIGLGNLDGALASLDTYTRLRREDPIGENDRAMVLVALHRLPDAEESLERATQLAPHDAEPWDNLGAVHLARGEGERAVRAFEHAIEAEPTNARFRSDLGSALLATGHAERAVESYRRAAELAPTDGVVLSNLGYALSLANRLDDAIVTLRHAVEVAPRGVGGWYNLGVVLARRGDTAGASDSFRHALAIDANDARARAALDALATSPSTHP